MKKLLLITLCSFMSFAFTSVKENSVEEVEVLQSVCTGRVLHVTFYQDCDGDGEDDFYYSATICSEHISAWQDFIAGAC